MKKNLNISRVEKQIPYKGMKVKMAQNFSVAILDSRNYWKNTFKIMREVTSLVVQWVRIRARNAGGPGSIPGRGTRSRMHAATTCKS